jgi:hypothetical protein
MKVWGTVALLVAGMVVLSACQHVGSGPATVAKGAAHVLPVSATVVPAPSEAARIEAGFAADPGTFAPSFFDLKIAELNRVSPRLAQEFHRLPDFRDPVDPDALRALDRIVRQIAAADVRADFLDRKVEISGNPPLRITFESATEKHFRATFATLNYRIHAPGRVIDASLEDGEPAQGDEIDEDSVKRKSFYWVVHVGPADADSALITIDGKLHVPIEFTIYDMALDTAETTVSFTLYEALTEGVRIGREQGLDGMVVIGSPDGRTLSRAEAALRRMVEAPGPAAEFSPLLRAWLLREMGGIDNRTVLTAYPGHPQLVQPVFNFDSWSFEETTRHMTVPELIQFWVNTNLHYEKDKASLGQSPQNLFNKRNSSRGGDCEDYAILGSYWLEQAGIETRVVAKVGGGGGHAVGAFRSPVDGRIYKIADTNSRDILGPYSSWHKLGAGIYSLGSVRARNWQEFIGPWSRTSF